jgi:hypothetical protein
MKAPELKPWMINDKMWASGIRANKWRVPESWAHMGWFATRDPHKWEENLLTYFDYTFAIMLQKDFGWH